MRRCRGEEPLSEFLVCQLAEQICPQAVHYDLGFYHQKLISKCRLFTDEEHGLAKISDFSDHPNSVSGLMKFYEKFGAEDVLWRIFVLDALILNTDRHPGNFGFLFDNQTMEVKTAAPMFDHNRSLLKNLDGFRFAPYPTIELPKGRLEALNAVVEQQRRAILE